MNKKCPKCSASNPDESRFCSHCGMTLQATMVQGKTVVMDTTSPAIQGIHISRQQERTIVQQAEKSFGTAVAPVYGAMGRSGQREEILNIIDRSGSMGSYYDRGITKLEAAKQANVTMLRQKEQIDPDDEMGIIQFDDNAQVLLRPVSIRQHKQQIIKTIGSISVCGGTDINEGLKTGEAAFNWNRKNVVKRIVLLTDGHGGHPVETANRLKSKGVVIDVIGVGESPAGVDEKLLRTIASRIEGEIRYRFIKDQRTLVAHYTLLANKTATI